MYAYCEPNTNGLRLDIFLSRFFTVFITAYDVSYAHAMLFKYVALTSPFYTVTDKILKGYELVTVLYISKKKLSRYYKDSVFENFEWMMLNVRFIMI